MMPARLAACGGETPTNTPHPTDRILGSHRLIRPSRPTNTPVLPTDTPLAAIRPTRRSRHCRPAHLGHAHDARGRAARPHDADIALIGDAITSHVTSSPTIHHRRQRIGDDAKRCRARGSSRRATSTLRAPPGARRLEELVTTADLPQGERPVGSRIPNTATPTTASIPGCKRGAPNAQDLAKEGNLLAGLAPLLQGADNVRDTGQTETVNGTVRGTLRSASPRQDDGGGGGQPRRPGAIPGLSGKPADLGTGEIWIRSANQVYHQLTMNSTWVRSSRS